MGCTYWNFPETNDDWIVDGTWVYSHKPLLNINRVIRLEIVFCGFKDFVMFIFNIQGLIIIAYSYCLNSRVASSGASIASLWLNAQPLNKRKGNFSFWNYLRLIEIMREAFRIVFNNVFICKNIVPRKKRRNKYYSSNMSYKTGYPTTQFECRHQIYYTNDFHMTFIKYDTLIQWTVMMSLKYRGSGNVWTRV